MMGCFQEGRRATVCHVGHGSISSLAPWIEADQM